MPVSIVPMDIIFLIFAIVIVGVFLLISMPLAGKLLLKLQKKNNKDKQSLQEKNKGIVTINRDLQQRLKPYKGIKNSEFKSIYVIASTSLHDSRRYQNAASKKLSKYKPTIVPTNLPWRGYYRYFMSLGLDAVGDFQKLFGLNRLLQKAETTSLDSQKQLQLLTKFPNRLNKEVNTLLRQDYPDLFKQIQAEENNGLNLDAPTRKLTTDIQKAERIKTSLQNQPNISEIDQIATAIQKLQKDKNSLGASLKSMSQDREKLERELENVQKKQMTLTQRNLYPQGGLDLSLFNQQFAILHTNLVQARNNALLDQAFLNLLRLEQTIALLKLFLSAQELVIYAQYEKNSPLASKNFKEIPKKFRDLLSNVKVSDYEEVDLKLLLRRVKLTYWEANIWILLFRFKLALIYTKIIIRGIMVERKKKAIVKVAPLQKEKAVQKFYDLQLDLEFINDLSSIQILNIEKSIQSLSEDLQNLLDTVRSKENQVNRLQTDINETIQKINRLPSDWSCLQNEINQLNWIASKENLAGWRQSDSMVDIEELILTLKQRKKRVNGCLTKLNDLNGGLDTINCLILRLELEDWRSLTEALNWRLDIVKRKIATAKKVNKYEDAVYYLNEAFNSIDRLVSNMPPSAREKFVTNIYGGIFKGMAIGDNPSVTQYFYRDSES